MSGRVTCVECVASNIEEVQVSEDDNTEHREVETRDRERVRTKLREIEHSE